MDENRGRGEKKSSGFVDLDIVTGMVIKVEEGAAVEGKEDKGGKIKNGSTEVGGKGDELKGCQTIM